LQVRLERTHRKKIDLKTKEINWLIGKKKSHLSIEKNTYKYEISVRTQLSIII